MISRGSRLTEGWRPSNVDEEGAASAGMAILRKNDLTARVVALPECVDMEIPLLLELHKRQRMIRCEEDFERHTMNLQRSAQRCQPLDMYVEQYTGVGGALAQRDEPTTVK